MDEGLDNCIVHTYEDRSTRSEFIEVPSRCTNTYGISHRESALGRYVLRIVL